jgi:hypothetical protein
MSGMRRFPADHTGLDALSAEQLRAKVLTAEAMHRAQSKKLAGAVEENERLREIIARASRLAETERAELVQQVLGEATGGK